jgi:hypothetical protein
MPPRDLPGFVWEYRSRNFPETFLNIFLQPQYVGHILRSLPTKWGFAWNWAVGENLESGLRS